MAFVTGVLLSLLASVFKASKGITTKFAVSVTGDEFVTSWGNRVVATVLFGIGLIATNSVSVPRERRFWLALFVVGTALTISTLLLTKAYKVSDVSLVAPLAAFVPVVTTVPAWVLLNQRPTPLAGLGIILITVGAYLLQIHEKDTGLLEPIRALGRDRGAQYVALFLAVVAVVPAVEKIGLQYASPLLWVFSTGCFMIVSLFVVLLVARSPSSLHQSSKGWQFIALLGASNGALLFVQAHAYTMVDVAYVQAIKRASLLLVILAGWLFFDEEHLRERLVGGTIICVGIALIIFFG